MTRKFIYLYIFGGVLAVGLLIYDLVTTWPNVSTSSLLFDIVPAIVLFYLAYKSYHEKKDDELM